MELALRALGEAKQGWLIIASRFDPLELAPAGKAFKYFCRVRGPFVYLHFTCTPLNNPLESVEWVKGIEPSFMYYTQVNQQLTEKLVF